MNHIHAGSIRNLLMSLIILTVASCGGGGGSGSTGIAPPGPGNTSPPAADTPPDASTDHAFLTDHFSGSDNCSICHDGLQDSAGSAVSIVADWQAGMMANSSRDPLWRAKMASEVRRNPTIAEEIESTCARCHTPMGHVEAEFATADTSLLEDGLLHPDNPLFDAAAEGVSCTLCHQISDASELGSEDGFSGGFDIPFAFGIDRVLFGQYENPLTMPMVNQVAFTPAMSPHISESEMCATCHNLATPVLDPEGNVTTRTFPEQMVYTEWENSDFADAQSCQDCHLPAATGDVRISTRPMGGLRARPDFSRHTFVGGNTFMLDMLAANAQQLNITATGFDRLLNETRAFLGGAVSLALEDVQRVGDSMQFSVRLSNYSGHKFPTGFPSRRAWLHVAIIDAQGASVFESGAVHSDGSIVGLDSDTNLALYEPHYELIESSDQVQSYETIMEDVDQNLTYTLLAAADFRKDNRLLPAGMDKTSVPSSVRPRGNALADPDFTGGSDVVRYQVAGLTAGNYTIEVRLNFQSVGYSFIADLIANDDDPRVTLFKDLNENARMRFETISSASANIAF